MAVYYGDPNADGVVDMGDAILAERFALGLSVPTADQRKRADVDGDGLVTMADVQLIEQYVLGAITQFPVELILPAPSFWRRWGPLLGVGAAAVGIVVVTRKG